MLCLCLHVDVFMSQGPAHLAFILHVILCAFFIFRPFMCCLFAAQIELLGENEVVCAKLVHIVLIVRILSAEVQAGRQVSFSFSRHAWFPPLNYHPADSWVTHKAFLSFSLVAVTAVYSAIMTLCFTTSTYVKGPSMVPREEASPEYKQLLLIVISPNSKKNSVCCQLLCCQRKKRIIASWQDMSET